MTIPEKTEVLLIDASYALDRAFGDYGTELTAFIGMGKALVAIGQELKRMNDRAEREAAKSLPYTEEE